MSSTPSIPDGISWNDLNKLLKSDQATENTKASNASNKVERPYNGLSQDELIAHVQRITTKLYKEHDHPMFAKCLVLEILGDLIGYHNDIAESEFEKRDIESATCWLRDCGKLQAMYGTLLDVAVKDDFTIPDPEEK